jgi:hypothetical protein
MTPRTVLLIASLALAGCAQTAVIPPPMAVQALPLPLPESKPVPQYREMGPCEADLSSSDMLRQIHVSSACVALQNSDVQSVETQWCWRRVLD